MSYTLHGSTLTPITSGNRGFEQFYLGLILGDDGKCFKGFVRRRCALRGLLYVAAASSILACNSALAQDDAPLVLATGRELLRDTDLFVGRTVVVIKGYCFYDQPNYVCLGQDTPFEVKAPTMTHGSLMDAIQDKCGGLDGAEHNPTPDCAYSFRFKPRAFKPGIGDYVVRNRVQSNKRLIYFETNEIEPLKR